MAHGSHAAGWRTSTDVRQPSVAIDQRLRQISESSAVLFYIAIDVPQSGTKFESANLRGRRIPDTKGERVYSVNDPSLGPLRVSEFLMPPFDVTVATSALSVRQGMREYLRLSVLLLGLMLLGSIAIGADLSRLMLRPLRLIRETAGRIGSDNLSHRIPVPAVRDEISDVARLLNATFDRLEASFDQIRRFSDEASHELKTPLSLVRLHAEKMLRDGGLTDPQAEAVVVQIEELARLNQIIDELLFLSRAEANAVGLKLTPTDPAVFLEGFGQDAQALVEHTKGNLQTTHSGRGLVALDEKWIRQVLPNVLTNALNVSPPGGRITLRSELSGEAWRVSVEDEGPGVSPEQRERIFERFVRLGPSTAVDRGSGLGLAISRSIVRLHGGRIYAEPAAGPNGLCVTFEIPARPLAGEELTRA